jgi:hypothetical protein
LFSRAFSKFERKKQQQQQKSNVFKSFVSSHQLCNSLKTKEQLETAIQIKLNN